MSQDATKLDTTLIWEQTGHLSDVALQVLVDAELSLLPVGAVEHAEHCEQCARRLGRMARLSLEIDGALDPSIHANSRLPAAAVALAPKPVRSLPVTEIVFAVVLALLGELPTLQAVTPAGIRHTLRGVARLSLRVLEHIAGSTWSATLPWLATSLLLVASGCIAFAARSGLLHRRPSQPS